MSKSLESVDNFCWKLSLGEHEVRVELVMYSRHGYGTLQILLKPEIVHDGLEKDQNKSIVDRVISCDNMKMVDSCTMSS